MQLQELSTSFYASKQVRNPPMRWQRVRLNDGFRAGCRGDAMVEGTGRGRRRWPHASGDALPRGQVRDHPAMPMGSSQ